MTNYRNNTSAPTYQSLLNDIMGILLEKGLKATTMSSIASSLKISKRTLYEIFESKSRMAQEAVSNFHANMLEKNRLIARSASNIIEAMLLSFINQRDTMQAVNADFFRDMDSIFPEVREMSDKWKMSYLEDFVNTLKAGAAQGLFRKDINYMVQCRMIYIQMESLKRMEELFPKDISLMEVYDSICIAFLRGIVTPGNLGMLDAMIESLRKENRITSNYNNHLI